MSTKFTKANHRGAKLTATQVYDIRALYNRGDCTQGQLARDFQVSIVQIGRIVRGEVWQSLPANVPTSQDIEDSVRRMLKVQEETQGINRLQAEGEKILGPAKNIMGELDEEQ